MLSQHLILSAPSAACRLSKRGARKLQKLRAKRQGLFSPIAVAHSEFKIGVVFVDEFKACKTNWVRFVRGRRTLPQCDKDFLDNDYARLSPPLVPQALDFCVRRMGDVART
jgi:hypothetical protein